jgi:hypothetical protein
MCVCFVSSQICRRACASCQAARSKRTGSPFPSLPLPPFPTHTHTHSRRQTHTRVGHEQRNTGVLCVRCGVGCASRGVHREALRVCVDWPRWRLSLRGWLPVSSCGQPHPSPKGRGGEARRSPPAHPVSSVPASVPFLSPLPLLPPSLPSSLCVRARCCVVLSTRRPSKLVHAAQTKGLPPPNHRGARTKPHTHTHAHTHTSHAA